MLTRYYSSRVLNFKSSKAYEFFIGCKDNHKAWESFEIFLHGTVLELIHLYSKETEDNPNPLGFLEWQSKTKSATLKLLIQMTLHFALGIYIQRIGDRNNDISISDAGRYYFLSFFYGFNHPYY